MSVRLMSAVWEYPDLSPTETLVLLKLADCANDQGASVYPSVAHVCAHTKLGERTVRRTIKVLAERGFIAVDKPATSTHPTVWRIVPHKLLGCQSGTPEVPERHPGGARVAPDPSGDPSVDPSGSTSAAPSFDVFWDLWPHDHRIGRKQAEAHYAKLKPEDRSKAVAEVGWRVKHDPWWRGPRPDGKWGIPHPFRYLRDRRFEDARPQVTQTRETIQQQTRSSNAAALAKMPVTILYD